MKNVTASHENFTASRKNVTASRKNVTASHENVTASQPPYLLILNRLQPTTLYSKYI